MKTLLFVLGTLMCLSFGSTAQACGTSATDIRNCPVFTPQGDTVTRGTVQQSLRHWVTVCYPSADWSSQQERTGQDPYYVSRAVAGNRGLRNSISDYQGYVDMADAKLIENRCYKQFYHPGWRLMTITQCRSEGFYEFLITKELTAADHGTTVEFFGSRSLDQFAYLVQQ